MYKRITFALFCVFCLICFSGCNDLGISDALSLDDDKHIKLNFIDDDSYDSFEYKGTVYNLSEIDFLRAGEGELFASDKYEYLGWTGSRFWYRSHIFADSLDNPTFIYSTNSRDTYFREDYNYLTDTFIIEGTDDTIRLCDDLLDVDSDKHSFGKSTNEIVISSVNHPTLTAKFDIMICDGSLYACAQTNTVVAFRISENFTNVLIDNHIVERKEDGSFVFNYSNH